MNSNIKIVSKQKTLLKDRIKKVKNFKYLKPIDFEVTFGFDSFEMNGKIIYIQY